MANLFDWINLSNATHNGAQLPDGWEPLVNVRTGSSKPINFGPITTQAYRGPKGEVVLTIKGSEITDVGDWLSTNPAFVSGGYPDQMRELVKYAKSLDDTHNIEQGDNNVSVTGFSQGGGLSQLLSHTSEIRSFSLLAQRKRTKKKGTPMSGNGFSKSPTLGEGKLTKAQKASGFLASKTSLEAQRLNRMVNSALVQTVPRLNLVGDKKISPPPIRGSGVFLNAE